MGAALGTVWFDPFWGWAPDATETLDQPEALREPVVIRRPRPAEPSSIQPPETAWRPSAASAAETGRLRLDVLPPAATVYVDGFYAGPADAANAAGGLTLGAGWHRLEFRTPGYETAAANVTIAPRMMTVLHLTLQAIS